MVEIKLMVEKISQRLTQRRALRELFHDATNVYVRTFDSQGGTDMAHIKRSLLGFDGYYGGFIDTGARLDVIGCDKNGVMISSVSMGKNQSK